MALGSRLAMDPEHYKRIADVLQQENDAQVQAIEQLERLLADEISRRTAAENALEARMNLGFEAPSLPPRRRSLTSTTPQPEGTDSTHRADSDETSPYRPGSAGAPGRRSNHVSPTNAQTASSLMRNITVTKITPMWVYKHNPDTHEDAIQVIRGLRAHLTRLEAQAKQAEQDRIKAAREAEARAQDLQRKLNKREGEIAELKDALKKQQDAYAALSREHLSGANSRRSSEHRY